MRITIKQEQTLENFISGAIGVVHVPMLDSDPLCGCC